MVWAEITPGKQEASMSSTTLSLEQEKEAQQLASRVQEAIEAEILQMTRILVSKEPSNLFGKTEFDIRDIVHRIGAKVFELHLAQKKTAMKAAVSPAPTVSGPRNSKGIAPKRR
jgi:hypothetical protein